MMGYGETSADCTFETGLTICWSVRSCKQVLPLHDPSCSGPLLHCCCRITAVCAPPSLVRYAVGSMARSERFPGENGQSELERCVWLLKCQQVAGMPAAHH